jgi:imidazolonepropionase-like amidohydrolase
VTSHDDNAKGTGATALKLYANLSPDLVANVTAEAHRQGMLVWSHATIFPTRPSAAVAAGVDVLSHSPYLVWEAVAKVPDDCTMEDFMHNRAEAPRIVALLKAMHERGTILDATLLPFLNEAEHHPQKVGAGIVPWSYAVTRLAHERGVLIDVGTDSSGLPATQRGTITAGKRTDLVTLAADPTRDIRNTTKIVFVVKSGRIEERGQDHSPAVDGGR